MNDRTGVRSGGRCSPQTGTPGLDALLPRLLEGLVEPVVVLVGDEVDPHRPLAEVRGSRDRAHRAFGRRSGRAAAGDPGRGVSRPARGGGPRRRPRHLPPPPRRRSRGRASARNGEALACARSWCGVETRRQIGDGLHGLSMAAETRTENRCSGAAPLFLPRAGSQLNIAIDGLVGLGGGRRVGPRGRSTAPDGPRPAPSCSARPQGAAREADHSFCGEPGRGSRVIACEHGVSTRYPAGRVRC